MAAKLVLPCLSISVFYAIFYYAKINGLQALAEACIASRTLPGSDEPLRTVYTGVGKLDEVLTTLTTFFWPLTDGSRPGLLLHSVAFAGSFGSAWILISMESWRRGNAGTVAAFATVFGLTAQVLTFAFAIPLYCAVHLVTSVTARKPSAENLGIPHAVLRALPFAFVIGMLVPSGLMILPQSETITSDLKQILIASWHPWPAYVAILLGIAHLVLTPLQRNDGSPDSKRSSRRSLRYVYAFAFANVAISHLVCVTISLATVAAPAIFAEPFLESLHPLKVFETPLPWQSPVVRVDTVGQGMQTFLRWDYLIGTTGVLVWAVSLYKTAHRAVYGRVDGLGLLIKTALLTLLSGPVGAAVELLWERDELVLHAGEVKAASRKN